MHTAVGCGLWAVVACARVALVTTVQKTVCDLALSALTRSTGSIGVDIAGVDAEVRRLREDLESPKEDLQEVLQRTRTELARRRAGGGESCLACAHGCQTRP